MELSTLWNVALSVSEEGRELNSMGDLRRNNLRASLFLWKLFDNTFGFPTERTVRGSLSFYIRAAYDSDAAFVAAIIVAKKVKLDDVKAH